MNSLFEVIINNGIPKDVIYFLLTISFVTMVGTFGRYVLGLKLMGMNAIIILSYVLGFIIRDYSLESIGVGAVLTTLVFTFSYLVKRLTVKLRLHSFARISLVITLISFLLLGILMVMGRFDEAIKFGKLDLIFPFPIVLVVMLSEYFSSYQTQKGIRKARKYFLNTLLLASVTGLVLSLNQLEQFMFSQPYIVVTFMLLTLMFGRYKGLRLAELFRFKGISYDEDDES